MIWKTVPFAHQQSELDAHGADAFRAIFWEQGTGKTWLAIASACQAFEQGKIDGVLAIAPNGVHRNWIEDELTKHLPDEVAARSQAFFYSTKKANTQAHQREVDALTHHEGLAWLAMSYDAVSTKQGHKTLVAWFRRRKGVLLISDEAQVIKNPKADVTKEVLRWGPKAIMRRVLTGTPITQGPFDVYPQVKLLDPTFWERAGFPSFAEFRAHFGVFGLMWNPTAWSPETGQRTGRNVEILKGYRRLDELRTLLSPIASRVTKDQVLDLPPKLYQKRYVELSDEQKRHYRELRDEFVTWLTMHPNEIQISQRETCPLCHGTREIENDGMFYPCEDCANVASLGIGDTAVVAPLAMVRMLRLQQVICGYLPTEDDSEPLYRIPGPNRRLEAALDICEEAQHKVIVWGRFRMDLDLLQAGLAERGISCVRYDGTRDEDQRSDAKARFTGTRRGEAVPEGEQAKVILINPAAGATGLTLVQAKTVIFYSNSFKLGDRLQAEDRNHRIGQDNSVLYIDLVADSTVDEDIVDALREKRNVADQILGDVTKKWI